MSSRWIIGIGDYLEQTWHAWQHTYPNDNVEKIEIAQYDSYEFDLSVFDKLSAKTSDVFIAVDERFGNFKRMELFRAALERGFAMTSYISPNADVAKNVVIGKNVFIGPCAIVNAGCRLDYNCVIHANSYIGVNSHLRSSVWIEPSVHIGQGVSIGTHATLRTGAIVRNDIKIGKLAELGWQQIYTQDIADKTVYDTRYDEPIYVYGN